MTAWFPAEACPARPGYYEVTWLYNKTPELWFNYWDGKRWWWGYKTLKEARKPYEPVHHIDGVVMLRWRGQRAPNDRGKRETTA